MGLDTVELVMDLEERFDTAIPDDAAEQIQTVGELHAFLMRRIRNQASDICPSATLFYPIRRLLVDEFSVERKQVRPSTRLETLIEAEHRRQFWRRLQSVFSTCLPRLRRARWLQWKGDTFPNECSTVAQLIEHCIDINRITNEFGPDDSEAVWETLCEIVANIAYADKQLLTPETHFLKDLGF